MQLVTMITGIIFRTLNTELEWYSLLYPKISIFLEFNGGSCLYLFSDACKVCIEYNSNIWKENPNSI